MKAIDLIEQTETAPRKPQVADPEPGMPSAPVIPERPEQPDRNPFKRRFVKPTVLPKPKACSYAKESEELVDQLLNGEV